MSNLGNVVGGHKANLNNPSMFAYILSPFNLPSLIHIIDTSEESKANSKQVLEGELADVQTGTGVDDGEKNPNRVAGGLKA